jgi:hypothetical protein
MTDKRKTGGTDCLEKGSLRTRVTSTYVKSEKMEAADMKKNQAESEDIDHNDDKEEPRKPK